MRRGYFSSLFAHGASEKLAPTARVISNCKIYSLLKTLFENWFCMQTSSFTWEFCYSKVLLAHKNDILLHQLRTCSTWKSVRSGRSFSSVHGNAEDKTASKNSTNSEISVVTITHFLTRCHRNPKSITMATTIPAPMPMNVVVLGHEFLRGGNCLVRTLEFWSGIHARITLQGVWLLSLSAVARMTSNKASGCTKTTII